jgi:KDO2-lipid IV(A) lauroyltransferase
MWRLQKTVVDFAAYAAVRCAVCLIQTLPMETCQAWARRLAWVLCHLIPLRRRVVLENLAIAFPKASHGERMEIARGMWEHLLLMIAEIVHAPRKIHRTNWREHSLFPQLKQMTRRLMDHRPLVLISGHLGNFEMGGYLLGLHGFPTHTIARRLDNPYLDRWINEFRAATGQFILPKQGCTDEIDRLLADGGTLVLLGDQHAGDGGLWVDFFGRPASTHKAVALFTLGADAPTAVCGVLRRGRPLSFELCVAELVDPAEKNFPHAGVRPLTAWYSRRLEDLIRRDPAQYWWVHRRWKGDPTRRRGGRTAARAA